MPGLRPSGTMDAVPTAPAAQSLAPEDCQVAFCSTGEGNEHFRHIPVADAVADLATPAGWVHTVPVLDLATYTAMCARPDTTRAQVERLLAMVGNETLLMPRPDKALRRARQRVRVQMLTAALDLPLTPADLRSLAGIPLAHPDAPTLLLNHPLAGEPAAVGQPAHPVTAALELLAVHVRATLGSPAAGDRPFTGPGQEWRAAVRAAHPHGAVLATLATERVARSAVELSALCAIVLDHGGAALLDVWQALLSDARAAGAQPTSTECLDLLRTATMLTTHQTP